MKGDVLIKEAMVLEHDAGLTDFKPFYIYAWVRVTELEHVTRLLPKLVLHGLGTFESKQRQAPQLAWA